MLLKQIIVLGRGLEQFELLLILLVFLSQLLGPLDGVLADQVLAYILFILDTIYLHLVGAIPAFDHNLSGSPGVLRLLALHENYLIGFVVADGYLLVHGFQFL